jgi:galactokinase
MTDHVRVRLEPEEIAERSQQLAQAVRALVVLEEEHKDARTAMAQEKKAAQRHVRDLADVVRTGVEDRPAQLHLGLDEPTPPAGGAVP